MVLQGNPLGGQGLADLCQGIASCVSLIQVNLRAVGLCHQDTDALRTFANVMSCHRALQDVNLDGNLIGELASMPSLFIFLCSVTSSLCP